MHGDVGRGGELVEETQESVLVRDGQENEVVRSVVPLRDNLGALDAERKRSVNRLRCLLTGPQIGPGDDVELRIRRANLRVVHNCFLWLLMGRSRCCALLSTDTLQNSPQLVKLRLRRNALTRI